MRARGVAVFKRALSAAEVAGALDGCWSWIERASPWRRGDPATWNAEGTCFSERHGVCFVAGQCEGSWAARSAPGVRACFAAVWDGADDLIASMEPLILWRPWRDPSDAARTAGGWLHYDDDEACYDGRTTVQGLAALTRLTELSLAKTRLPAGALAPALLARIEVSPRCRDPRGRGWILAYLSVISR